MVDDKIAKPLFISAAHVEIVQTGFKRKLCVARPAVFFAVRAIGGKTVIVAKNGVDAHFVQLIHDRGRALKLSFPFEVGMNEISLYVLRRRFSVNRGITEAVIDEARA